MTQPPKPTFSLSDFVALLDDYGSEPDQWPERYRDQAFELLHSNDAARQLHLDSLELANLLSPEAVTAPAHLSQALFNLSPAQGHARDNHIHNNDLFQSFLDILWRPISPAIALICIALIGGVIGYQDLPSEALYDLTDLEMLHDNFDQPDFGFEEGPDLSSLYKSIG